MSKETWMDASTKLEACMAYIGAWMSANILILNQGKMELIVFELRQWLNVSDKIQLEVKGKTIHVAHSVENLDMCLDTSLTMQRQVNAIFSACHYCTSNVGRI